MCYNERLDDNENALDIIQKLLDVIVDGTDNFPSPLYDSMMPVYC